MIKNRRITVILGLALCMMLLMSSITFAQVSDIQNHWAGKQINEWINNGLANGYQDGTFKPDNTITRAEFMTLVNKAFGFTTGTAANFSDVSSNDWFAGEVAKASAAGYISGYADGTLQPNKLISRQEVAVILSRILKLDTSANIDSVNKFQDAGEIPAWSKGAIGAVVVKGYMNGYPDHTFQPIRLITRAEAIVTLDSYLKSSQVSTPSVPPVDSTNIAIAPMLIGSEVTTKGDIGLSFDKDITDPSGLQEQFTVKINDIAVKVTAVQKTNTVGKIKLVLETKVQSSQKVSVTYTKSTDAAKQIKAVDGGILESFGPKNL